MVIYDSDPSRNGVDLNVLNHMLNLNYQLCSMNLGGVKVLLLLSQVTATLSLIFHLHAGRYAYWKNP